MDCVFGSRFTRQSHVVDYPIVKRVLNRMANTFIRLLFGYRYFVFATVGLPRRTRSSELYPSHRFARLSSIVDRCDLPVEVGEPTRIHGQFAPSSIIATKPKACSATMRITASAIASRGLTR